MHHTRVNTNSIECVVGMHTVCSASLESCGILHHELRNILESVEVSQAFASLLPSLQHRCPQLHSIIACKVSVPAVGRVRGIC